MNYHNFGSRLAFSRPVPSVPAKALRKPARKAVRRSGIRRPLVTAAATVLLCFGLHEAAQAQPETAIAQPPPPVHVDTATWIVTLTGAIVALVRVRDLWRADFPS